MDLADIEEKVQKSKNGAQQVFLAIETNTMRPASSLNLTSSPRLCTYHKKNRAKIASAWHDRVRKAEEEYLAAAATTTTTTTPLQPQAAAVGGKPRLHGRGRKKPSRGVVSASRGGAARGKQRTMGGRGGRVGIHDGDDGGGGGDGDGDADALACIGKTLEKQCHYSGGPY